MLPAFIHLPLSTGYVLAGLFTCTPHPAPDVTVNFYKNPPRISHARSSAYLMSMKQNSSSPNYGSEFPELDGVTRGQIQFKYNLDFSETEEIELRQACVRTKSAHITVTYTPTIYISSNVAKGTCRYAATLDHEMKHVRVDLDAIHEFLPDIEKAAANALRRAQTTEPISSRQVDKLRDDISEKLSKALDEQTDALQQTRTSRQRKIDSRAEYERLSNACAGER